MNVEPGHLSHDSLLSLQWRIHRESQRFKNSVNKVDFSPTATTEVSEDEGNLQLNNWGEISQTGMGSILCRLARW